MKMMRMKLNKNVGGWRKLFNNWSMKKSRNRIWENWLWEIVILKILMIHEYEHKHEHKHEHEYDVLHQYIKMMHLWNLYHKLYTSAIVIFDNDCHNTINYKHYNHKHLLPAYNHISINNNPQCKTHNNQPYSTNWISYKL